MDIFSNDLGLNEVPAQASDLPALSSDTSLPTDSGAYSDLFGGPLSLHFEPSDRPVSPILPSSMSPFSGTDNMASVNAAGLHSTWAPPAPSVYSQYSAAAVASSLANPSTGSMSYNAVVPTPSYGMMVPNGFNNNSLYDQQFMTAPATGSVPMPHMMPQGYGAVGPTSAGAMYAATAVPVSSAPTAFAPSLYAPVSMPVPATPFPGYQHPTVPAAPTLSTPMVKLEPSLADEDSEEEPSSPGAGKGRKAANKGKKRKSRGSSSGSAKKPSGDDDALETKRQQRLMRNRASAQLSRERKKNYMRTLELQLKDLDTRNKELHEQIMNLTQENTALKHRIQSMSTGPAPPAPSTLPLPQLSGAMAPVPGHSPQMAAAVSSPPALEPIPASPPSSPLAALGSEHASPDFSGYSSFSQHQAYNGPVSPMMYQQPAHNAHKRVRLVAPSFQAQMARTGMLLFAFMFSFALFYNMAGLDLAATQDTLPTATMTAAGSGFRSRSLHSIDESALASLPAPVSPASVAGVLPHTPQAFTPDAVESAGAVPASAVPTRTHPTPLALAATAEEDNKSMRSRHIGFKTLASQQDGRTKDLVLAGDSRSDGKAVVPGRAPSPSAGHSSARIHGSVYQGGGEADVFNQFRKIVTDGNISLEADTSYMFCPQAVHIRPTAAGNVSSSASASASRVPRDHREHKERAPSPLPGRHGLSLPGPKSNDSDMDQGEDHQERLRFWVPASSILSSAGSAAFAQDAQPGLKHSGMAELSCVVSNLRPIMMQEPRPS